MKLKISKSNFRDLFWWLPVFGILFFYRKTYSFDNLIITNFALAFIDLVCLICVGYLLRQVLIPKFLYKKNLLLFIALFFVVFIVFANVIQLLEYGWYYISNSLSPSSKEVFKEFTFQIFNSYLVVFSAGIGISALKLLTDQWLSQSRYAQLEKEKAQTELSFLKAQINPHFLFNSINSIFAHIDKSNVIAREIVLKFSDMLRYQLYDCNSDKISFEKEIAYLINYVELQRLRKDEKLELKFETIGEMFGFEIAPLVLIPFLENAFKYASNHDDKQNLLKIILTKETDYFSFYCSNTKDNIVSGSLVDEGGIGIANVKRRLELIYPGKHELMINNNKDSFEVKLKIQII